MRIRNTGWMYKNYQLRSHPNISSCFQLFQLRHTCRDSLGPLNAGTCGLNPLSANLSICLTFWYRSVSAHPYHRITDPDPALFFKSFHDAKKNLRFLLITFLESLGTFTSGIHIRDVLSYMRRTCFCGVTASTIFSSWIFSESFGTEHHQKLNLPENISPFCTVLGTVLSKTKTNVF